MMPILRAIQKARGWIGGYLSRPRISKFLGTLILFFSATQLGIHFWPPSSLVYGVRIDYLSPTLYFLDLLILIYLLSLSLKSYILNLQSILPLLPLLLVNLLYSSNPLSSLAWSLHFYLYLLFVLSLAPVFLPIFRTSLACATTFQVTLATIQVALGHSLGGPLYYLGERMVSVGQPNVATASFMGNTLLRAYGTFGHPNVLAGWLLICLLILLRLSPPRKSQILSILLVAGGILLTQSRSAALALFGFVIPFFLLQRFKSRLVYFALLILPLSFFLTAGAPSRSDFSFSERLNLQQISLQVIRSFPIFGSGAQASISTYPALAPNYRLLQPDHNSFTLLLSWFGLAGTLAILYILIPHTTRPYTSSAIAHEKCALQVSNRDMRNASQGTLQTLSSLGGLLPLLLLDHYLLTSPQGLFILLLYLQITLNYPHAPENL